MLSTSYSEAAYFDGNHCAHCAARDEHLRLQHKRIEGHKALARCNATIYHRGH